VGRLATHVAPRAVRNDVDALAGHEPHFFRIGLLESLE
jgi:hypothetical protein